MDIKCKIARGIESAKRASNGNIRRILKQAESHINNCEDCQKVINTDYLPGSVILERMMSSREYDNYLNGPIDPRD